MTTIDVLDTDNVDDVDISEVGSNVNERRICDSKQKKTKKKESRRISTSTFSSSRKSKHHENTDDVDEESQRVVLLTSSDNISMKKEKIAQWNEKKKKPQTGTSLSTHNVSNEDNDSHSNTMDVINSKTPPSPKKKIKKGKKDSKTRAKPLVLKDKKKKKKMEKLEEEDENRHKISLERAMKRVSNPGTENPAEVFLISGDSGVGKSYWVESQTKRIILEIRQDKNYKDDEELDEVSDDDRCNFYPVICRGTCEIPPRIQSDCDDKEDKDVSKPSSTSNSSTESFCNNGCGISRSPMHGITEALNNLICSLTIGDTSCKRREQTETAINISNFYGGKAVWKKRIEEALGITEASHLASTGLVPELGVLLNLPVSHNYRGEKKASSLWDWNSPHKFHRSCLAIRDLLRAISEFHHPVIMVLHNLQQADKDTYRLLNFLLTGCHWDQNKAAEAGKVDVDERLELEQVRLGEDITTTARLNNFLLIGLHEGNSNSRNDMLHLLELSFYRILKSNFEKNQEQPLHENERDNEIEPLKQPKIESFLTKIHMKRFHQKKLENVLRLSLVKTNENKTEDGDETGDFEENLQDLAGLIYEWTGGNIFYVLQVFEYLKEEGAITSSPSCKWNIDKVQAQSRRWNNSVIGLTAARIDRLPEVVRFVLINASIFRQTYIEFSLQELFLLLSASYADRSRKKKGEMEFPLQSASELENALDLACDLGFMKRVWCRQDRNGSNFRWAFAHTMIRDEAYSLFAKKKKKKKMEIHLRLGSKASALAFAPTPNEQESNERNVEHDAFKFLAADQLAMAEEILDQESNRVALLFVETAEKCISKSAFCAAIRYLTVGIKILERNGGCFTVDNHGMCLQMHLLLARLHSVYTRDTNETDKAFSKILENGRNLKDQIMLHHAEIGISIGQNNYQEALKQVVSALELLGEKSPQKIDLSKTISRQIEKLRQEVQRKDNHNLLQPIHCIDKKTFDVMTLLSNLIEISRLCKNGVYEELATIRMMNICLISGFTPQYSMSFSHYGAILMERAFVTNNLNIAKEGYRMGQICEKIARIKSFYGGHSLTIFHHYISHWRRPYRRSLAQILSIYNAQLESGDYFHIQFTTFTYVQYHLTSGHNLTKLDDNLQLFDVLYQDYKMENHWKIQLPQILVANFLGETSDPYLFYGNTIEDQNSRIHQMEKAGENDAVQMMHFLILFTSIFFNNHELSKSCLEKIVKKKVISIWKPWIIFFQCFTDILSLPTINKKAEKKKLKETINEQRDLLLDWYNQGAINCSVMVSLIDAEYMVTDAGGKKPLATLRIQKFYDDAIAVAREQELKHIEAFCLERASMQFEAVGAEELSAEYIAKAHQSYFEWNAIAKVDDVEEKHATKLKFAKQEKIVVAGNGRQNSNMHYNPERGIGGGRNKIKSINIKGVAKTAGKMKKIAFRKANVKSPKKSPQTPSRLHKFSKNTSQKMNSKMDPSL